MYVKKALYPNDYPNNYPNIYPNNFPSNYPNNYPKKNRMQVLCVKRALKAQSNATADSLRLDAGGVIVWMHLHPNYHYPNKCAPASAKSPKADYPTGLTSLLGCVDPSF